MSTTDSAAVAAVGAETDNSSTSSASSSSSPSPPLPPSSPNDLLPPIARRSLSSILALSRPTYHALVLANNSSTTAQPESDMSTSNNSINNGSTDVNTADLISYLDSHPHHLIVGDYTGQIRHFILGAWQSQHLNIAITDVKQAQLEENLHQQANLNTASTSSACVKKESSQRTHILVRGRVTSRRPRGPLTAPFSGQLNPETGFLQLTFSVEEIKNARPLLHSFLASLTVCSFHVQWKCAMTNDRGKIVISGSVGEEHYECQCDIGTSLSVPRGCPLILQPVSTLALICRYLDATSLIAVYKTNPQLSSAASHPITHQSGNEVAIDSSSLDAPRSYLINGGMTCAFNSLDKMRAAFSSRLLRHIRSVKISPPFEESIEVWLQLFLLPHAPSLRCLKILLHRPVSVESHLPQLVISSCFQYLRLLHLTVSPGSAEVFCQHLPLSLELLHLSLIQFVSVAFPLQTVPSALLMYLQKHTTSTCTANNQRSHLRKLVFDTDIPTWFTRMTDLKLLEQIEMLNVIDEIHWALPFNPRAWKEVKQPKRKPSRPTAAPTEPTPLSFPRISLITSLRIPRLHYDMKDQLLDFDTLSGFVNLSSLHINSIGFVRNDPQPSEQPNKTRIDLSKLTFSEWPEGVRQTLRYLTVLLPPSKCSLAGAFRMLECAKLDHLVRLNIKNEHTKEKLNCYHGSAALQRLFVTIPQLTELSLANVDMPNRDCLSFRHLPHLTSLKEFKWPSRWTKKFFKHASSTTGGEDEDSDDDVFIDYSDLTNQTSELIQATSSVTGVLFSSLFPSLTTLHIASSAHHLPYQLLRQLSPQLSHFKWLNEEWIHSSERIEMKWQQAALQRSQLLLSTRPQRITTAVRQTLDYIILQIHRESQAHEGTVKFDSFAAEANQGHANWYKGNIKRTTETGQSVSEQLMVQQKLATFEISKDGIAAVSPQPLAAKFQFDAHPFSFGTASEPFASASSPQSTSSTSSAMFGSSSFSFSPTPIAASTDSMTSSFTAASTTVAADSTPSFGTSSFSFSTPSSTTTDTVAVAVPSSSSSDAAAPFSFSFSTSAATAADTVVDPSIVTSSAINPFSAFSVATPHAPSATATIVSSDATLANTFSSQLNFDTSASMFAATTPRSSSAELSNPFSSFGSTPFTSESVVISTSASNAAAPTASGFKSNAPKRKLNAFKQKH